MLGNIIGNLFCYISLEKHGASCFAFILSKNKKSYFAFTYCHILFNPVKMIGICKKGLKDIRNVVPKTSNIEIRKSDSENYRSTGNYQEYVVLITHLNYYINDKLR